MRAKNARDAAAQVLTDNVPPEALTEAAQALGIPFPEKASVATICDHILRTAWETQSEADIDAMRNLVGDMQPRTRTAITWVARKFFYTMATSRPCVDDIARAMTKLPRQDPQTGKTPTF